MRGRDLPFEKQRDGEREGQADPAWPHEGGAVRRRRIVVVASLAYSLINFRLELLKGMVAAGHDVTALAPDHDEQVQDTLAALGIDFQCIPMDRTAVSPLRDIRTIWALKKLFRRLKPDVVLSYTMKPVIYAGIAARMAGVPKIYALMTGLGYIFSDEAPSTKKSILRRISVTLYRAGLRRVEKAFVYNPADADDMRNFKMLRDFSKIVPVAGSGVDLDLFAQKPVPTEPLTFLMITRRLGNKGVREFAAAARKLGERHSGAMFQLLGPIDSNPAAISQSEIDDWVSDGVLEYLGKTRDVRPYLAKCSVYVLPSYYREGIPRAILEALAVGRAVITSDMPGCREGVIDGENGFLVQPRDPDALAHAMEAFITDSQFAVKMGARSNDLARLKFDVHKVNRHLLSEMGLI